MTVKNEIARYRRNLQGEVDGAAMYRAMADLERQPERADVYRRLAAVEEAHASFWLKQDFWQHLARCSICLARFVSRPAQ